MYTLQSIKKYNFGLFLGVEIPTQVLKRYSKT